MTNRYPSRQVARDYRNVRPDRRVWLPDNDNKPGWKPPRPRPWIPANDNRPVPKLSEWSLSPLPKVPGWARWARNFMRILGPLGWALTAYELWELYQWYMSQGSASPAEYWFCHNATRPGRGYQWENDPGPCTTSAGWASDTGNWGVAYPWYVEYEQWRATVPAGARRKNPIQAWRYSSDPGFPAGDPPVTSEPRPWVEPDLRPDLRPPPWEDPWVEPYRPLPKFPPRPRTRRDPRVEDRPKLPEDKVSEEPVFRPKPDWRTEPYPRKPRKRERERKVRLKDMPNQRLRRLLGWLLSAASESGDFLEALYDSLPGDLKSEKDTMAQKFDKVFRNLDKVDFTEAVNNIWTNHVEDRYFGKGFKDMTDALEAFGLELPSLKL